MIINDRIRDFAKAHEWVQFHSPKNITMALSAEVTEILSIFCGLQEEQSKNLPANKLDEVGTELARSFILCRIKMRIKIMKSVI